MENNTNLILNTKFISFDGVIGRRDYALNIVYIAMINLFITIPYSVWVMANVESISEIFNVGAMLTNMPLLLKLWILLGTAAILPISISNIIRRFNDICGKINTNLNLIIAIAVVIAAYSGYFLPALITIFLSFITFIISMMLIFTPGKVTSKMPYDVTKVFNWGAFFGTWIWGLINKSYIPCWYLLLFFTPWGFYFQLICGLKGNEWAYNNKKCTDVEKFNESQQKQTTIWTVLTFVGVPVLYIIFIILITVGIAVATAADTNKNGAEHTTNKIESIMQGVSSIYFESHEITETENKYYILPSDWVQYSFSEKKDILDMAASTASIERRNKFPKNGEYYSKTSELKRTKIYSSKTNQLLGEYVLDEGALANASFKDWVIAGMKAYKFYRPTEK